MSAQIIQFPVNNEFEELCKIADKYGLALNRDGDYISLQGTEEFPYVIEIAPSDNKYYPYQIHAMEIRDALTKSIDDAIGVACSWLRNRIDRNANDCDNS